MSYDESDTPDEWVPFDTILCYNESCGSPTMASDFYLYLGIGPFTTSVGGHGSAGTRPVQLLLSITSFKHPSITWSHGDYMVKHYHIYNPETCGPLT